jgi:hypothetical protein
MFAKSRVASWAAAGDEKSPLKIVKLNAMAYPNSANAYDSLSDAYLADGDNELARQTPKGARTSDFRRCGPRTAP